MSGLEQFRNAQAFSDESNSRHSLIDEIFKRKPAMVAPQRTSWKVDALHGKDDPRQAGSAKAPLKTVGELTRRLHGVHLSQDVSVDVVGDFSDEDFLMLMLSADPGATLTITGAVASSTAVTITNVTQVSTAATGYWELDMTGIDLTTIDAKKSRIVLPSGEIAMVVRVVDSDTVRVGAFHDRDFTVPDATPVTGAATLETLYECPPPDIMVRSGAFNINSSTRSEPHVVIENLAFVANNRRNMSVQGAAKFYGCAMNCADINITGFLWLRTCFVTCDNIDLSSNRSIWTGSGTVSFQGVNFVNTDGSGFFLQVGGLNEAFFGDCVFNEVTLSVDGACAVTFNLLSSIHWDSTGTFAPISVSRRGTIHDRSTAEGTCGSSHAINCINGGGYYFANQPTFTGQTTADVNLAGTNVAFAAPASVNLSGYLAEE